jgi:hypothetical protein
MAKTVNQRYRTAQLGISGRWQISLPGRKAAVGVAVLPRESGLIIKNQKWRLMLGSLILTQLFIGIPLVIFQFIGLEFLENLLSRLANYGVWIILVLAIPWIALSVALIFLGRKIGPIVISRFYTREEMYEILAGPLSPRPLQPRRENSINRQLEYLYK